MPPARRKGRTSGVAKTKATPNTEATPGAEATTEVEATPEAEAAPEEIDITEDLESALAMEEDSSNENKSEDVVEADTVKVDKKEDNSDDIILEKEILREEEMEEVEDSEAEEEELIEVLMKEDDNEDGGESSNTKITVTETEKVEVEGVKTKELQAEGAKTKSSDKEEEVVENKKVSGKSETNMKETEPELKETEPELKETEKKFKVNKIVMDIEDSDLEFQVKEDDLFENDETPIIELLKCSICENVCARGVYTKCCQSIACRLCATKKITLTKQCWNCKAPIKTDELVNSDDIRKAVVLFKTDQEIPDDLIQKMKDLKQQQGSKSTKIDTVKSGTPAKTMNEVVKSGSPGKAKSEVPEKKRSPFFKMEKHELAIMENGFESRNSKVYVSIQGTRFCNEKKFQSYVVQIGLLESKTGESKIIAINPAQVYREDLELQKLLHIVKKSSDVFEIESKDGKNLECCRSPNIPVDGIINFLKKAKDLNASKNVDLVFFTNAEHHELYRCYGTKLKGIVNKVISYEDVGNKKELKPMDGGDWMADKWVLHLRKLFSDVKIEDVNERTYRKLVNLPFTKTDGVLLISPIHTDLEKYMTFKQSATPELKKSITEKRKSTDNKVSENGAKKPKMETKDEKKVGDLRKKLLEKKNTNKDSRVSDNKQIREKDNRQTKGNDNRQSRGNDIRQSRGNDTRQSRGNDNRQSRGNDNRQARVNESYNRRQNNSREDIWTSNERSMDPWAKGNQSDINFGYSGNQSQVNSMYNRESQVGNMFNRERKIPSLFEVRPSMNSQRSNQMMGNNGKRFDNDMGMNVRKTDDRSLSAELMHKQLALQQEAQRIEKLKLELELEKIRMERAKISEKQNQMGAGSNLMRGDTAAARNPMMGSLENYSGDRNMDNSSSQMTTSSSRFNNSGSRYQEQPASRYQDQPSSRHQNMPASRYQDQLSNQMVGSQSKTNQIPSLLNNPMVNRMNSLMNTPMHDQKYNQMGQRNMDMREYSPRNRY